MQNRSSKPPKDLNRLAAWIAENTTDETLAAIAEGKNPAAVALGRLGGLKGGRARASKLSAKERKEVARKAAAARWKNHSKSGD